MKTIKALEFARYGSQRLLLDLLIPDAPVPSGGYSLVMWVSAAVGAIAIGNACLLF